MSPDESGCSHSRPAELALVRRVHALVGYVPVGFGDLLHVLAHEDVMGLTLEYLHQVQRDRRLEDLQAWARGSA